MPKVQLPGIKIFLDRLVTDAKEKGYADALKDYQGNLILAGINYDKETKHHSCSIEKIDYSNF